MTTSRTRTSTILGALTAVVLFPYLTGLTFGALYFNWTYARDHGFGSWLAFGEFVATAKAVVWPYFAYRRLTAEPSRTVTDLPKSLQNFFFATDALVRANERPADADPQAVNETLVLLREAVDSARSIDRGELNDHYAGLGDHFLDDAIGAAGLYIVAFENRSRDEVLSASAAWIRWTNWWNRNAGDVMASLIARYNLETR